ncbi:hypothetical protein EYF80_030035 [Liparis tanakae]|uniref:Uncharacterized protein n=1 Tax=Liparis tanakae TaxID=230148 RepID=A0A4Z2H4D7_9TELE|nr:hypothetical protein EYF80_030035 [Liparis tanakae]
MKKLVSDNGQDALDQADREPIHWSQTSGLARGLGPPGIQWILFLPTLPSDPNCTGECSTHSDDTRTFLKSSKSVNRKHSEPPHTKEVQKKCS